jgi:peptide/nickel transport system substrate-binding protein
MGRILAVGLTLMLTLELGLAREAAAQTKEDTLVYALQSDVDTWDPPNSVLREAIILGYNVFDHLATRDLKTRKVIPNLATSWKAIDDVTWEVKLRQGVKFHDGIPSPRETSRPPSIACSIRLRR